MKLFIFNLFKNALGAFTGQLIGLNVLDADVAVWKQAAAAGLGSILLGLYNWATPPDAPGKYLGRNAQGDTP